MAGCCTSGSTGNTGIPNGVKPFGTTTSVILVPLMANDGTLNHIDMTTALSTQLVAKLNQVDASKRFYPYTALDTYTEEEAEATTVTNKRGLNDITRRGVRSVLFEKWGVNEQFYKTTKANCQEFGIYKIDECGNLQGRKDGTKLYPIAIYQGSSHSIFMDKTEEAKSMVRYTFQFSDVEGTVDNRWMLTETELGLNPNAVKGMIDVNLVVTSPDATNLNVQANFGYGTALAQIPFLGAVTADFTLTEANGTPVTVTATDNDGGNYNLNMTAVPDIGTLRVYRTGTAITSGYIGSVTFDFS